MIRSRKTSAFCMAVALALSPLALAAQDAQPTDYWQQAGFRANGLDLDDDFIVGEPEDSLVCDLDCTDVSGEGCVEDVDGDGDFESQFFAVGLLPPVGMSTGTDSSTCGGAGSPCRTLSKAWENADIWASTASAEPIVCVAGQFPDEAFEMPVSGQSAVKTKPIEPFSNEQREFDYPSNPAMLVGVDSDDDGIYPPYDPDDLALFESTNNTIGSYAWQFNSQSVGNYIEVAHVEFKGWGSFAKEGGGLLKQTPGGNEVHSLYLHDFAVDSINKDQCHGSNTIVFNQFSSNRSQVAVEYGTLTDILGYIWRGGFFGTERRYRGLDVRLIAGGRAQNVNGAGAACSNAGGQSYTLFRVWNLDPDDNAIEMIDNVFEFDYWQNGAHAGGTGASGIALCGIRDFSYVGNRIVNVEGGLPGMDVEDNVCVQANNPPLANPRLAGDWLIARNTVVVTDYSDLKFNLNRGMTVLSHVDNGVNGNGTLKNVNPAVNGMSGYFIVEDNEIDFTLVNPNKTNTFHSWSQHPDGDYDGLTMTVRNNDIVGCFSTNPGALFNELPSGAFPVPVPGVVRFDDNIVHAPGASCSSSNQEGVKWGGAGAIPDFSATNNSFSHCRWDWAGTIYNSAAALDSATDWTGTSCNNAAPVLGNYLACPGPPVLTLDGNQFITDTRTELGCQQILVSDYVVGTTSSSEGNVTMLAGDAVLFGDGFSVQDGAELHVRIDSTLDP